MLRSKLAVKVLETEESEIFYDPIYQGRTLKVIGIDRDPTVMLEWIAGEYRKLGYSAIIFDTRGEFKGDFDTIITIKDGEPAGLDPIKMWKKGLIPNPYTAATILQTVYELDNSLTNRLYADILSGKIKSVHDAVKAGEKYSEVILESYTSLDENLYSGDAPELKGSVLVNLGETYSVTVAGTAFLILAAALEKRREVVIGIDDAAVLAYTTPGGAAMPLLTSPSRRRVSVLATRYVVDQINNTPGPTLLLYTDPDIQTLIYDANGVPPGDMRKHVHKKQGVLIWRTPETIDVEWGEVPR